MPPLQTSSWKAAKRVLELSRGWRANLKRLLGCGLPQVPAAGFIPAVEVAGVSWFENDSGHLIGRNLESPLPGARLVDPTLDVSDWVIGRLSPAVAVEVVSRGVVLRRIPVRLERPDVAAVYPPAPGAHRSGFRASVSVLGREPEAELLVQVVLENGSRESLAVILIRRREDSHHRVRFQIEHHAHPGWGANSSANRGWSS